MFGACGRPCPDGCDSEILGRRYWFVLALENSRCEHYVTEKYWNKLHADALPVVNGGLHGERDYLEIGVVCCLEKVAPAGARGSRSPAPAAVIEFFAIGM